MIERTFSKMLVYKVRLTSDDNVVRVLVTTQAFLRVY